MAIESPRNNSRRKDKHSFVLPPARAHRMGQERGYKSHGPLLRAMQGLDPRAIELLHLAPGEAVIGSWEGTHAFTRGNDELVLTTDRVILLVPNSRIHKSWEVTFDSPLEQVQDPAVTRSFYPALPRELWGKYFIEIAGHKVYLGKHAAAAVDAIARARTERTRRRQPPEAPAPPTLCPRCGSPANWIAQYGRWYCVVCRTYL